MGKDGKYGRAATLLTPAMQFVCRPSAGKESVLRQISRYESPSQRRRRRRRTASFSILGVVALLVLAPIVGTRLGLPYDLNILHFAKKTVMTVTAPFKTPLSSALNSATPSPVSSPTPIAASDAGEDENAAFLPETTPPLPADIAEPRQRYALELTLNDDASRLDVKEQIEYTNPNVAAIEAIPLRVYAGEPRAVEGQAQSQLVWSRVIVDGQACAYTPDDTDPSIVWVHLPATIAPGQTARMSLAFSCELPDNTAAFGRSSRSVRLTNFYPTAAGFGPNGWLLDPPNGMPVPYYAMKGDYTVSLIAPDAEAIHATGQVTQQSDGSWKIEAENVRDIAIVFGPDRRLTTEGKIQVSASRTAKMNRLLENAKAILAYDAAILGPYNESLAIFESGIDSGSATHAGLIVIDVPDDERDSKLATRLAFAIARLFFGSDIAGDATATALNELICQDLAARYAISIGADPDEAYEGRPEAKEWADLLSALPAGDYDAALREYRIAANGRAANAQDFGANWDSALRDGVFALVERYRSTLRH